MLATGLLALALAAGSGRMAPPPGTECHGRNGLTSYFGHVVGWRRSARQAWLRIATDYGTTEDVSVPLASATDTTHFLLHGQPFGARQWSSIETRPGVLRPGTRATAWVCLGSSQPPLVDWNGATE